MLLGRSVSPLILGALFFALSPPAQASRSSLCADVFQRLESAQIGDYYALKQEIDPESELPSFDNKNLAGTFHSKIPVPKTYDLAKTQDELLTRLKAVFEIPQSLDVGCGVGVRKLLEEVFRNLSGQGYGALLPEDNYPVYAQLAAQAGLEVQTFRTLPTIALPDQALSDKQVLVLTSPLSPAGRPLLSSEVGAIQAWLARNNRRRLVLDTVYTFENRFDPPTRLLLQNPQVLALHSFAKSYALPGHLGFAVGKSEVFGPLLKESGSVNYELASKALAVATSNPAFPEQIKSEIAARWNELTPLIRGVLPDWQPPQNGYYSVIPISAGELLSKHGIWTFPLSTFGSTQPNMSVISALKDSREKVYYVTVLSNFARGFDKYSMSYSKSGIPESTFPKQFYLLNKNELGIGVGKARKVLEKTMSGDRILVIGTSERQSGLNPNERNGKGRFIRSGTLQVENLSYLNDDGTLAPARMEDVLADSLELNQDQFVPLDQIRPRSISILPIASACQACCKFCFSEASISTEKRPKSLSGAEIDRAFSLAVIRGAERAVITGGGEPTLIGFPKLNEMARIASRHFPGKVTLITNGMTLSKLEPAELLKQLLALQDSGITVLAISRHHQDPKQNAYIMGKDTQTEKILRVYRENRDAFPRLRLRLICVLQKTGVNSESAIASYVRWAHEQGVTEVNFKELYVSTDRESDYSKSPFNIYSEDNRVPLRTVLDFARRDGWDKSGELPWGAPIFEKTIGTLRMRIAAYTEPSLFWERTHGVARSWNLMADGKLMMSLERGDTELSY